MYRCNMHSYTTQFLLVSIVLVSANRNPVHLVDNTYTTLLIAINQNVTEDQRLIDSIQEIFTSASRHLYQSTKQRAAFNNITILIPKTWSDDMTTEKATTEKYDIANVVVDEANPNYGDAPYVKQHQPCGEKGEYLHLTPTFIVEREWSEKNYGDSGKVIVHEWGHLQWGLFEEYATSINSTYYVDPKGVVEATRCSLAVTGNSYDFSRCDRSGNCKLCNTDPESGVLPDPYCVFIPDEPNQGTASYLYANYLDSVVNFCHSDPEGDPNSLHNVLAPTDQNTLCSYKSAWDVMEQSADFYNNNNPPVDAMDTTPVFKIVKENEFRTVLVMDVSGSMGSNNRLNLQYQAASKYIGNTLPLYTWVGIVEFGTYATTLANLTQIVDEETREHLISLLPIRTTGSTCVGCGLEMGVEVLEDSIFGYAAGGILFLTTDGEENQYPYIGDVTPELVAKEVIVDTLAFSDSADPKLVGLSDETGGRACWYSEGDDSTALHDCFTASVTERTSSSTETPVQLSSYKTSIAGGASYTDTVYIDSTIGRETVFYFFWDFISSVAVDVIITRPNGVAINSTDPQYTADDTSRSIYVKINGIAEEGTWAYEIYNPSTSSQVVEVSVDSKSVDSSTQPIRLSSTPSTDYVTDSPPMAIIYAEVNQGYSPVLDAKVIATVERPSPHSPVDVQLFDSGTGADVKKNDGVYSGYFVDFVEATCTTECRYNIQVTADDYDQAAQIRTISRSGAMPRNYTIIPGEEEGVRVGDFSRVVQGGMIQVDNSVVYVNWSDPNDDPFPPSRIIDLLVIDTSYDNATVTLQWTATGDDQDKGTAFMYDLRFSTNFSQILNNFDGCDELTNANLTNGTLTEPKESGQIEVITAILPSSGPGFAYYFAIRATDDVGNIGISSNTAQTAIVAAPIITTTTNKPTTTETTRETLSPTTVEITTMYQPISDDVETWKYTVLGISVFIFVLAVTGGLIVLYKNYKRKNRVTPVKSASSPTMELESCSHLDV